MCISFFLKCRGFGWGQPDAGLCLWQSYGLQVRPSRKKNTLLNDNGDTQHNRSLCFNSRPLKKYFLFSVPGCSEGNPLQIPISLVFLDVKSLLEEIAMLLSVLRAGTARRGQAEDGACLRRENQKL